MTEPIDEQLEATMNAMLSTIKAHNFQMKEAVSMRYLINDLPKYEGAKIYRIEEATRKLIADGLLIRKGQSFYMTEEGFKKVYE